MKIKEIACTFLFLILMNGFVYSQQQSPYKTNLGIYGKSNFSHQNIDDGFSKYTPLIFTLYGFIAIESDPLKQINFEFQEEILEHHPTFNTHVDDYLQYTPVLCTFSLKLTGHTGKNDLKKSLLLFGTSTILMAGSVYALKKTTKELRPDGSNRNSFPSGHTATAFSGAELLHQEFKNSSPILSYTGYVAATATGALRMYNNKHYFSDVLAGAGIGILSTRQLIG